jgi:pyrroline-5-carboxylate reductase
VRVGFVGTGHIAAALVEGLARPAAGEERLLVSPRGRAQSARLAATHSNVMVAPDNQSVVDQSDVVVLSVPPSAAAQVLAALRFRADQLLLSLVGVTPIERVRALAPEPTVVRAVPVPAARLLASPTAVFPSEPRAAALLSRVGSVFACDSEHQLNVYWSLTALIGPTYALLAQLTSWLSRHGVPAEQARRYAVQQFLGTVALAADAPDPDFTALAQAASTPGGLNEQALAHLRAAGVYGAFSDALDAILTRLESA